MSISANETPAVGCFLKQRQFEDELSIAASETVAVKIVME